MTDCSISICIVLCIYWNFFFLLAYCLLSEKNNKKTSLTCACHIISNFLFHKHNCMWLSLVCVWMCAHCFELLYSLSLFFFCCHHKHINWNYSLSLHVIFFVFLFANILIDCDSLAVFIFLILIWTKTKRKCSEEGKNDDLPQLMEKFTF